MPRFHLRPESSLVVAVDVQPKLLAAMCEADRVVDRARFLLGAARVLDIPVLATEQNRARMGDAADWITDHATGSPIDKMAFGCFGSPEFVAALEALGRRQLVVVGVETHVCVSLTALAGVERGYEVVVCPDAVTSRTMDRHKLGMERIRDGGAVPAHTEAVAYEWMESADHPRFRDILALVKAARL